MRGMVMEVKGNILVVLTPQGKYLRIKNNGTAAIGDFVPCENRVFMPVNWIPRNVIAVAASLMLICSAGLGAYGYSQPFGIVSIDINPSMTLTYNWFEQVIAVEALNPDAQKLLNEMGDLKNKPVPEAIQIVLGAASDAGYMKAELANVVFISVSDRNSPERTTEILNTIEEDLPDVSGETDTVLMSGTPKTYEQVKENHETPTKELVESSLVSKPEDDPVIHSSKPLKEILKDQKEKREKLSKPLDNEKSDTPDSDDDKKPGNDGKNDNPSKKPDDNNDRNDNRDNDRSDNPENQIIVPEEPVKPETPRPESDNDKSHDQSDSDDD